SSAAVDARRRAAHGSRAAGAHVEAERSDAAATTPIRSPATTTSAIRPAASAPGIRSGAARAGSTVRIWGRRTGSTGSDEGGGYEEREVAHTVPRAVSQTVGSPAGAGERQAVSARVRPGTAQLPQGGRAACPIGQPRPTFATWRFSRR